MYEEDRQLALSLYERMFDAAEDEHRVMSVLGSPTKQAVVIARAYNAKERKLSIEAQSRREAGYDAEEGTPDFVLAINGIFLRLYPDYENQPYGDQPVGEASYGEFYEEGPYEPDEESPSGDGAYPEEDSGILPEDSQFTFFAEEQDGLAELPEDAVYGEEPFFEGPLPEDGFEEGEAVDDLTSAWEYYEEEGQVTFEEELSEAETEVLPEPDAEVAPDEIPGDRGDFYRELFKDLYLDTEGDPLKEIAGLQDDAGEPETAGERTEEVPAEEAEEGYGEPAPEYEDSEKSREGFPEDLWPDFPEEYPEEVQEEFGEVPEEEAVGYDEPGEYPEEALTGEPLEFPGDGQDAPSPSGGNTDFFAFFESNPEQEPEPESTSEQNPEKAASKEKPSEGRNRKDFLSELMEGDTKGVRAERRHAEEEARRAQIAKKRAEIAEKLEAGKPKEARKLKGSRLALFLVIAIPATLVLIALLLVPTLLCLGVSFAATAAASIMIRATFGGFVMLADLLLLLGGAMIGLGVGLLFLWLALRLAAGAIVGLIARVIALGRDWCSEEVPENG